MSSKGKVTPMSDKNTAVIQSGTAVEQSKVHADFGWNSRAERNVQDMADTESAGFEGFARNIQASGQLTPIILRNTHGTTLAGGKTDKPYELVCGFRRFRAISLLNSGQDAAKAKAEKRPCVPNLADGTILADIREVKTVLEARILNGQENTLRKNLKAQDLVFLVRDLAKADMAQVPIANALGITQGWVSKLLKVASLPPAVLDHWRDGKAIPPVTTQKDGVFGLTEAQCKEVKRELTEPEMRALSELKSGPEEMTARYIRMVKPEAQPDGDGAPDGNKDKVREEVEYIAGLMGCMVRAGVLDNGSLDWNRVIGPKKKGYPIDCGKDDSQDRLLALGDFAREAFEREVSKGAKGPEAVKGASANN
jgi:ParB-like nuclease domain